MHKKSAGLARACIGAIALLLSGCVTELKHERLVSGRNDFAPGFSYFLPRTRIVVAAAYELKGCPDQVGQSAASGDVTVTQIASLTDTPVADPEQTYSLPLSTLTSGWKTTTFSGSLYEDQVLHSVGLKLDDRAGAVIKGIVASVVSVASIAIDAPSIRSAGAILCTADAYKALSTVKENSRKLLDPSLDSNTRSMLVAGIAAAKSVLTISKTTNVDLSPQHPGAVIPVAPKALAAWFNPKGQEHFERVLQLGVRVKDPPSQSPLPEALRGIGVIYRVPAPVIVQVCAGPCDTATAEALATGEVLAAQFGRFAVMPLRNGPFQTNNMTATFAKNGHLEDLKYGSESSFEKLAGSAAESLEAVEAFLARKKAAEEADAKKAASAELEAVKADTDLLKAKADNIEAKRRLEGLLP